MTALRLSGDRSRSISSDSVWLSDPGGINRPLPLAYADDKAIAVAMHRDRP